ncbi:MAG TPA: 2Fe-2S iron-sulfur cluster-binding protein [Candidatus Limnocylindrales bacterium]|nr:2Fe-2S iron-sulfur cluster-binding protein [Candidatus Limnocylindrales bacterium]
MASVTINGKTIVVPDGTNVVQAAEMAGEEIPHYCYHPGLSIAGNCRMCLVDIRAMSSKQPNPLPKLQIGCNTFVQDGMVIESNNPRVQEARQGVLEFLLINHPIDCPICDQAGECKLQEYYMDYGRYHSRFALEEKVEKGKVIPVGPDIMLDQERCILCTRCVRFLEEYTHTCELGLTERGDHQELHLASGKQVDNPYSTNIVDICPVGALTSREFRFRARVWYLDTAPSICAGCANGCNIDVDSRENKIFRLKPRANLDVNGYWMCDDGRRTWHRNEGEHRLVSSYLRAGEEFVETSLADVTARSAAALKNRTRVAVVASAACSIEEGYLAREIAARLGGGPLIVASPPTSAIPDDDKLISTDRFPNRAGLVALGYVEQLTPPSGVDAVLALRGDIVEDNEAAWCPFLENLAETVVVADSVSKTMAYANQVLAIGSHFESAGSFVNRHGRLQIFPATIAPPGQAAPGWQVLANFLAELGGPLYLSADEVFRAACIEMGLGEGRTYAQVGAHGVPLESWKGRERTPVRTPGEQPTA